MKNERDQGQPSKEVYDAVDHTEGGAAFYHLYSEDGLYRAEILVTDGKISGVTRYQVNDDGHTYPSALAGDHRHSYAPADLEARAATRVAVLEATPPEQRAALSAAAPEIEQSGGVPGEAENAQDRTAIREAHLAGITPAEEERPIRISRSERTRTREEDRGRER